MDNSLIFGSLGLTGVAVSLLVQYLKQRFVNNKGATLTILVVVSVLAGGVYFLFQKHLAIWQDVLSILVTANLTYNFILQFLEAPTPAVTITTQIPTTTSVSETLPVTNPTAQMTSPITKPNATLSVPPTLPK